MRYCPHFTNGNVKGFHQFAALESGKIKHLRALTILHSFRKSQSSSTDMLSFLCIQQRSTCQEKGKNPDTTLLYTLYPWVSLPYEHNAVLCLARFPQLAEVPWTSSPALQGITCCLQKIIAHKRGEDTLHPWSRLLLKLLSSTGTSINPWLGRRASYFITEGIRLPEHSLYLINLCWF